MVRASGTRSTSISMCHPGFRRRSSGDRHIRHCRLCLLDRRRDRSRGHGVESGTRAGQPSRTPSPTRRPAGTGTNAVYIPILSLGPAASRTNVARDFDYTIEQHHPVSGRGVDGKTSAALRAEFLAPAEVYDKFRVAAESYFVEGFSSGSPPMGPRVPCGSVRR